MNRRNTLFGIAALAFVAPAKAGTFAAFSQAEFDKLKAAKSPILLHVAATWCGECVEQRKHINSLDKNAAYKDLQIITIDFDKQKDIMREFGVSQRTTLIGFKNGAEVGRFTGDTSAAAVEALMKKLV